MRGDLSSLRARETVKRERVGREARARYNREIIGRITKRSQMETNTGVDRGEGRQKIRPAYVVIQGFCFSADKATLPAG